MIELAKCKTSQPRPNLTGPCFVPVILSEFAPLAGAFINFNFDCLTRLVLQSKYFLDSSIHALQYLDLIQMKDPMHKANFYHNLKNVLPFIPKVTGAE